MSSGHDLATFHQNGYNCRSPTAIDIGPRHMALTSNSVRDETDDLLRQAAAGDRECWGLLLSRHRDRLVRMIALRIDDRLAGRLDASDVIQEAYLEASARLPEYLKQPDVPFFVWLRFLTGQRLAFLHRHHLGVHMRNAAREVSLDAGGVPATTAAGLADRLVGHEPRPSEVAVRNEIRQRFEAALNELEPVDREVIAMRHYEQLTNAETAQVLAIQESAASKRYIRALEKLRSALADLPENLTGFLP